MHSVLRMWKLCVHGSTYVLVCELVGSSHVFAHISKMCVAVHSYVLLRVCGPMVCARIC